MSLPVPVASSWGLAATLLAALLSQSASAQPIYRWVDRDGGVHYSAQPPREAAGVRTVKGGGGPPAPSEFENAVKQNPVTLYESRDCEKLCNEGRELLAKRGIPYRAVNIDSNEKLDELKKISGAASVPVLLVGSKIIKGYEPGMWNQALDAAGYPAKAPANASRAPAPPPAPAKGPATAAAKPAPAQPPQPRPDLEVRLYVTNACGQPCEDARKALAEREVTVTEIAVAGPESIAELQRVSGGTAVPVLVVGKTVIKGFEAGQYRNAIDKAPPP